MNLRRSAAVKVLAGLCATAFLSVERILPGYQLLHESWERDARLKNPPLDVLPNTYSHYQYRSTLKFFFVVGLEGSGHHLMNAISKSSPVLKRLKKWDLYPQELRKMHNILFNKLNPETALWNAHCSKIEGKNSNETDLVQIQNSLVEQLRTMEGLARVKAGKSQVGMNEKDDRITVNVPINTAYSGAIKYGMASYPNYGGPCRVMNIPSLDLLYQACDKAQVDCGHVYIYRDPNAILKSTSINRNFNKDLMEAMHMYKSHLNVISAELHAFPERTLGCYGLLDSSLSSLSDDERPAWWEEVGKLWGWRNQSAFDVFMDKSFKIPEPTPHDVVASELEPYRLALNMAHERTIRICEKAHAGLLKADR